MVSFEGFSMEEGSPIYLQIIDHIKRGAAAGTISDGEELPSRRVLSALLGVNPNTVQKAYRMLEDEGLIESRAGAKSYLRLGEDVREQLRAELLRQQVCAAAEAMKQMGVSLEQAIKLLREHWDEG